MLPDLSEAKSDAVERPARASRSRTDYFKKVRRRANVEGSRTQFAPVAGATKLSALRIDALRWAIRANQITFPSQIPTFGKRDRADLQWRFAQLYFVRGWNCEGIAAKYGTIHQRVRQILSTWRRCAVETGYIQFIPPVSEPHPVVQPICIELATPAETLRPLAERECSSVA